MLIEMLRARTMIIMLIKFRFQIPGE